MEKEISFQLSRTEEYLEVSSNIEDNLDIIEIEEIMGIITELLNCATEKIKNTIITNTVENNLVEGIDEEKLIEMQTEVEEEKANFAGNLIYCILNFIHNKDEEELKNISYSLAVYADSEDNQNKEVYETFHFCKVKGNEKLLACVAFFKDIAEELLKNNNSKEKVKQTFNKSMQIILYNIYSYIDKYKIIEE